MLHQIGAGVLGPVFRTYEPDADRLVAVKVFRIDVTPSQSRSFVEALQHLVGAGLSHPGLVTPLAAGLEGTTPYLAEEYIAAESFDIALRHYAPAAPAQALAFVRQMAAAIEHAHRAGFLHGALHPRDMFVAPEQVRVNGVGIAAALESVGVRAPVRRPYSAPERVAGEGWGARADVYGLAAVAHELLFGRRVTGSAERAAEESGAAGNRETNPVVEVLERALARDPAARFQSAAAFLDAFAAAVEGRSIEEAGTDTGGRTRKPPIRRRKTKPREEMTPVEKPLPLSTQADDGDEDDPAAPRDASTATPAAHAVSSPQEEELDLQLRAPDSQAAVDPDEEGFVFHHQPGELEEHWKAPLQVSDAENEETDRDEASPVAAAVPLEKGPAPLLAETPLRDAITRLETALKRLREPGGRLTPTRVMKPTTSTPATSSTNSPAPVHARPDSGSSPTPPVSPSPVSTSDTAMAAATPPAAPVTGTSAPAKPQEAAAVAGSKGLGAVHAPPLAEFAPVLDDDVPVVEEAASSPDSGQEGTEEAHAERVEAVLAEDLDVAPAAAFDDEPDPVGAAGATARHPSDVPAPPAGAPPIVLPPRPAPARQPTSGSTVAQPVTLAALVTAVNQTRNATWPLVLTLLVGMLIGFAGGYATGARGRTPEPPAAAADVQSSDGQEYNEAVAAGVESDIPAASQTEVTAGAESGIAAAQIRTEAGDIELPASTAAPASRPTAAAGSPPPASVAAGRLLVRSTPSGAAVAVNGRRRGVTPLSIEDLPLGSHHIQVARSGYRPTTRQVRVTANRPTATVSVTLAPDRGQAATSGRTAAAGAEGSMFVDSRPRGARVVLDGRIVGTTPLVVPSVAAGERNVKLERDGYRTWDARVRVTAGQRARVSGSLEPR